LPNRSRVLAFAIGGTKQLPLSSPARAPSKEKLGSPTDNALVREGRTLYHQRCAMCHGWDAISGGLVPDLRFLSPELHAAWDLIVREGAKRSVGMPGFASVLDPVGSQAIRQYVLARGRESSPMDPSPEPADKAN
jgi:quinohemoprotein ethanol dehydrogenase